MIVPMEKVTVLIFHKAKERFLGALQSLGVVHIALSVPETSDKHLRDMHTDIERCDEFLNAAAKYKKMVGLTSADLQNTQTAPDAFGCVQSYETIKSELDRIDEALEKLGRELRNVAPWGAFESATVKQLREIGITVRFFIAPLKKFGQLRIPDVLFEEIFRDKTYVYFVVFEKGPRIEIDCDEFFYPDTDLKQLEQNYAQLQQEKQRRRDELAGVFSRKKAVEDYCRLKKTQFSFLTVSANLPAAAEQTVYILTGWLPRSLRNSVEQFLQREEVYFYFSKPQPDESVPILLKNNRFSRLFEPITNLFALPQYTEVDLTAFFAPFFTLFFGFCLGDAGYGLIILIAALVARTRVSPDKRPLLTLVSIFGVSTFIFGLISGNLFGIDLSKFSGLKKMVLFDQNQLFNLALVLGVIQIFFGMFIKAISRIRQYGFMSGLSTFGWIIMLGGILSLSLSKFSIWAVYTGMALILLFNDLKANIFVRVGKGLWELYGITGIFGDVLSYIRLFALSISGSILGLVVNDIALQFRSIPFIGYGLTFVILVVGHTGNLMLSALSSFVHPLRLTFVEFYKNAGFEGGGKAYQPFRLIR
ncbi:MAG: V-type ATPase 116kDa subunit family protein [Candidatus Omnitrophica bacterium]|nr:V-type ATPase 116kDa subunit family protein [Candidatus Omnitrophota bacterium]